MGLFWLIQQKLERYIWFTCVPSFSDLADGPSCLDFGEVMRFGAKVAKPCLSSMWTMESRMAEFLAPQYAFLLEGCMSWRWLREVLAALGREYDLARCQPQSDNYEKT